MIPIEEIRAYIPKVVYLSKIFGLARSYRSKSWGKWASSSHDAPQPRTLAKSFPVPSGKTPTSHCN